MKEIYLFVVLLAVIASGQIMPYTYMGPVNGIYGPYGLYGPYGKFGAYGTGRFYGGIVSGPNGIYGPSGIHSSTYNSFYNQIQQRVDAYISPAITILADAMSNFQICGKEYLVAPNTETYSSCMLAQFNTALKDISILESKAKQPCNIKDN